MRGVVGEVCGEGSGEGSVWWGSVWCAMSGFHLDQWNGLGRKAGIADPLRVAFFRQ